MPGESTVAWERAARLRELTAPGRALILGEADELVALARDLLGDLDTANAECVRNWDLYMRCLTDRLALEREMDSRVEEKVALLREANERSIAARRQIWRPFDNLLSLVGLLGERAGTRQVSNLKAAAQLARNEIELLGKRGREATMPADPQRTSRDRSGL